jgi:glycosyltransferase involved in cell wall biosynthesis
VNTPLVTIICLCYNHDRFVAEALESVLEQTYRRIQLIIVDDASTDSSKQIIADFMTQHADAQFISHDTNLGNCKAFNSGLMHARGELVMDLSADDILPPDRVELGVREFDKHDDSFGVQFGDAMIIDETGEFLGYHSDRFPHATIPQGDVYEAVIGKYFISGPTTMVRKRVLKDLGGYDESLSYEDFDFWIRSSRRYKYLYTPKVLVKQRLVRGALHEKQFTRKSPHARTTLAVCRKIMELNRTRSEQAALRSRIHYEIRQAVRRRDVRLARDYLVLLRENRSRTYDF